MPARGAPIKPAISAVARKMREIKKLGHCHRAP
jgi:hypothetical protein